MPSAQEVWGVFSNSIISHSGESAAVRRSFIFLVSHLFSLFSEKKFSPKKYVKKYNNNIRWISVMHGFMWNYGEFGEHLCDFHLHFLHFWLPTKHICENLKDLANCVVRQCCSMRQHIGLLNVFTYSFWEIDIDGGCLQSLNLSPSWEISRAVPEPHKVPLRTLPASRTRLLASVFVDLSAVPVEHQKACT